MASSLLQSRRRPFPPWATHYPCKRNRQEPLPSPEEEAFLRNRTYFGACRQLDRLVHVALDKAWEQHVLPVLERLKDETSFQDCMEDGPDTTAVDQDLPSKASGDVTTNDANASSRDDIVHALAPPTRYPPHDIVPVLILHGPSHGLDRHAWIQHGVLHSQQCATSTTVWIQPHIVDWQRELVRQCWLQHDQSPPIGMSAAASVLLWARNELIMDHVDVYMHMDRGGSSPRTAAWSNWLSWLQSLRAEGLPITLILLVPFAVDQSPSLMLPSSTAASVLVRRVVVPTSTDVMQQVADQLERAIGIVLPSETWQALWTAHCSFTASFVSMVQHLRQELAMLLVHPGAALLVPPRTMGHPEHVRRLRWFMLHPDEGRPHVVSPRNTASALTLSNLHRLQQQLETARSCADVARQVRQALPSSAESSIDEERTFATKSLAPSTKKAILQRLLEFKTQHMGDQAVQHRVNELILLVDAAAFGHELLHCVDELLQKEWSSVATQWLALDKASPLFAMPWIRRIRHDVLLAMKTQSLTSTNDCANMLTMWGHLYAILLRSTSMSQRDLYQQFAACLPGTVSSADAAALLVWGVTSLQVLGLVKTKLSKGEILYEKAIAIT